LSEKDVPNVFPEIVKCEGMFGEGTAFVNGAIMHLEYQPVDSAWILELDLPRGNDTVVGENLLTKATIIVTTWREQLIT